MAKVKTMLGTTNTRTVVKKKTTVGRKHSQIGTSTMNKRKRVSYKKYRGQGR